MNGPQTSGFIYIMSTKILSLQLYIERIELCYVVTCLTKYKTTPTFTIIFIDCCNNAIFMMSICVFIHKEVLIYQRTDTLD